MPPFDFPRDEHPALEPADDAVMRGQTPDGRDDEHVSNPHATLPPVDDRYQQSNTRDRLDHLLADVEPRRRIHTLFPSLFIRAVPGDQGGGRPLWRPTAFWESCDIHLLPAGAGTFDFTKTVLQPIAGQSYRIFVHVWNLGRFPAFGACLRAWWVEPGFFNGSPDPRYSPHFIGGTYFDLGDRDSGQAHRLIEVRPAWTVQMNQDGHECLIVAVESATDPWDGVMDANNRRHVAQRNVNLVTGGTSLAPLVSRLAAQVAEDQQLLITHSAVATVDLAGAAERGQSSGPMAPRNWNHTAIAVGADNVPVAAVQRGPAGLQFFNLRDQRELPDPDRPLAGGVVIHGELQQALPDLLQHALGVQSLTGAAVAAALAGDRQPRMLRFSVTDTVGQAGGYSVLVAPGRSLRSFG